MTRIQVGAPVGAPGSIRVEDVPLNVPLRGVKFEAALGSAPVLYLEAVGDVLIDVEGVVVQSLPAPGGEQPDTLTRFLDTLDPDVLEAKVIELLSDQGLGESTTGQACIAALRTLAGADVRT